MLSGKKIILGVCGSIAAYKSAVLTRLLVKAGAEVRVIMTPSALDFITPSRCLHYRKTRYSPRLSKTRPGYGTTMWKPVCGPMP